MANQTDGTVSLTPDVLPFSDSTLPIGFFDSLHVTESEFLLVWFLSKFVSFRDSQCSKF